MVKKKIARARKHILMIILEREGEREKETACVTANERKYIFVNSEETRRNHFLLDVSNINQSLNSFQKYFCVSNVWNKTSTLLKKLLRILRTYQDVKKDKSVGTY